MIKRGLPQKASIAVQGVSTSASVPDPNYCKGQSCCYTVDKREGPWNFSSQGLSRCVAGLNCDWTVRLTRDRWVDGKQQVRIWIAPSGQKPEQQRLGHLSRTLEVSRETQRRHQVTWTDTPGSSGLSPREAGSTAWKYASCPCDNGTSVSLSSTTTVARAHFTATRALRELLGAADRPRHCPLSMRFRRKILQFPSTAETSLMGGLPHQRSLGVTQILPSYSAQDTAFLTFSYHSYFLVPIDFFFLRSNFCIDIHFSSCSHRWDLLVPI